MCVKLRDARKERRVGEVTLSQLGELWKSENGVKAIKKEKELKRTVMFEGQRAGWY